MRLPNPKSRPTVAPRIARTATDADTNRNKMVLLVVPSQTDPDHAHAIVMAAAAPNNSSPVDTLLEISQQDRGSRRRATAANAR